ncbi:hypothetical protein ACQ4PT_013914 [Festuca glaucescens]
MAPQPTAPVPQKSIEELGPRNALYKLRDAAYGLRIDRTLWPLAAARLQPSRSTLPAGEIDMEKETTRGIERAEIDMVKEEPKRPRVDDEEEQEMLDELAEWRDNWAGTWSDYYGSVDKRSAKTLPMIRILYIVGPVQFTMGPVPSYARLESALQIFSVKVVELKGTTMMCWPIDVYGFIAVRDSVDLVTATISLSVPGATVRPSLNRFGTFFTVICLEGLDTTLVLNGPSRAVQLIDPVMFEVELRVKGTRPSEDKLLSGEFFDYNCITGYRVGSLLEEMVSGPRSTLQFKYAHLRLALEAQIKVWFAEGSTDLSVKFVARTASIDENATLLECKDVATALSDDGSIGLSRNVLVVEGNNGVLIVGAQVKQQGDDEEAGSIYREISFTAATYGESHGTLDVGFCKMNVVVAWSLLF